MLAFDDVGGVDCSPASACMFRWQYLSVYKFSKPDRMAVLGFRVFAYWTAYNGAFPDSPLL